LRDVIELGLFRLATLVRLSLPALAYLSTCGDELNERLAGDCHAKKPKMKINTKPAAAPMVMSGERAPKEGNMVGGRESVDA
jgi:hypothetical protein